MTGTNDKLRGLFLATLMVLSVFGGTIALSGTAAAANGPVSVIGVSSAGNTVGDDLTVTVETDPGETITINNTVDGEVKNEVTVTDGGSNDEDSVTGEVTYTLVRGKTYGGSSSIGAGSTDGSSESDVRSYSTANYDVQVTDEVRQGNITTVEGTISEYPGEPLDHTINYSLQYDADLGITDNSDDPNTIVLADSDTSDGTFIVRRTFDEVNASGFENDYPTDGAQVGSASGEPGYIVYVDETDGSTNLDTSDADTEPDDQDNDGSDIINARLKVSADTDPSTPVYGETIDIINGQVSNATQGLGNYQMVLEEPDTGFAKTVSSASDGSFEFTAVVNDAGTWRIGTSEGAFIPYQDVNVTAQEPKIEFSTPSSARQNFQTTFSLQLNDTFTDNPIDTQGASVDGYVNISGPFSSVTTPATTGTIDKLRDVDSDADIEYIEAETNGDGQLEFDATPIDDTQTATLKGANGTETDLGLEVNGDAGNTPDENPDYKGSADNNIGVAQPVNIINLDIQDPRTSNFTAVSAGTPDGNQMSIYDDNGPVEIEPLPYADTNGDRIVSGLRLGFDKFRGFDNMTVYRVNFTLVDEQSDSIRPETDTDAPELQYINFTGAGINTTAFFDDDNSDATSFVNHNGGKRNVVAAREKAGANGEYSVLIRPVAVDEVDESFDISVKVNGESAVSLGDTGQPDKLNTSGLYVSRFQVNGQTVNETAANQTIDLSSQVKNPETSPTVVNNGRVNVTQRQNTGAGEIDPVQLASTDARISSINNGSYQFNDVNVGPRGLDTDGDGIGDERSQLVFTAYQYADADTDNTLERTEVNNATVETLPLALNRNINVTFINATAVTGNDSYAGMEGGEFTLTKGVEYDSISIRLMRNGSPVDLTDAPSYFDTADPTLNEIDDASSPDDAPRLVGIYLGDDGGVFHNIEFADGQSNATNGTYTIGDIESTAGTANVSSTDGMADDPADTFVFGDAAADVDDTTSFEFYAQTPGLSNATADNSFVAAQAQVETDIHGAAGPNVPGTPSNPGTLSHDQTDAFNTNVSNITTPTIGIQRTYRVNATVYDALGDTPLNGSAFTEVNVRISEDDLEDSGIADDADIVTVGGTGNDAQVTADDNVVDVNNAGGEFQFDMQVTDDGADNNGVFVPSFVIEAQADGSIDAGGSPPSGVSFITGTPEAGNPRVNVFGENGAQLPTNEDGDQILAKDVPNDLRLEAFPNDVDGFVLPNRTTFAMVGSFAETSVTPRTVLNSSVDEALVTDTDGDPKADFAEGQIAFFSVTPTASGPQNIRLTDNMGSTVRDVNGSQIQFDVLRSNLQVDIDLSTSSAEPGDDITVTLLRAQVPETLDENVRVSLVNPRGNQVDTGLTDSAGQVTLTVPSNAQTGTYTVETRPAGFAPNSVRLDVAGTGQLLVSGLDPMDVNVTQGDLITVNATIENTGSSTLTQDVEFRVDGNVLRTQTVSVNPGQTEQVTFPNIDTSSLTPGSYTHGVFTANESQTATLTVEQPGPTLPAAPGNVTDDEWAAVLGQNGNVSELSRQDVLDMVSAYVNRQSIDNQDIERQDVLDVVQYYVNTA